MTTGVEINGGSGNKIKGLTVIDGKGVVIDGVEVTKDNIGEFESRHIIGDKDSQASLSDIKVNGVKIK